MRESKHGEAPDPAVFAYAVAHDPTSLLLSVRTAVRCLACLRAVTVHINGALVLADGGLGS